MLVDCGLIQDAPGFNKRIVQINTKLVYITSKFNLLREENEGYSKLVTLLNGFGRGRLTATSLEEVVLELKVLMGHFHVDPIRVVDIVLAAFERQPDNPAFVALLRQLHLPRSAVPQIMGFRLQHLAQQDEADAAQAKQQSDAQPAQTRRAVPSEEGNAAVRVAAHLVAGGLCEVRGRCLQEWLDAGLLRKLLMAGRRGRAGVVRVRASPPRMSRTSAPPCCSLCPQVKSLYVYLSPADETLVSSHAKAREAARAEAGRLGAMTLSDRERVAADSPPLGVEEVSPPSRISRAILSNGSCGIHQPLLSPTIARRSRRLPSRSSRPWIRRQPSWRPCWSWGRGTKPPASCASSTRRKCSSCCGQRWPRACVRAWSARRGWEQG